MALTEAINGMLWINPFTASACKMSVLKDARSHLKTVYFPVLGIYLLFMLCGLMKAFTCRCEKKTKKRRRKKGLMVSNMALLLVGLK